VLVQFQFRMSEGQRLSLSKMLRKCYLCRAKTDRAVLADLIYGERVKVNFRLKFKISKCCMCTAGERTFSCTSIFTNTHTTFIIFWPYSTNFVAMATRVS